MRIIAIVAGVLMSLAAVSAGRADDDSWLQLGKNADRLEARMGIMAYDAGVFSPQNQTGVVINGEMVFPAFSFMQAIGSPRPYIGFDYAPKNNQTDFLYAGFTWDAYVTERLYFSGSLGGAIHNAPNLLNPVGYNALGCRTLFHLGASVGFDVTPDLTMQLYADHFSNANTCRRNQGQEAAGVRFGYRF